MKKFNFKNLACNDSGLSGTVLACLAALSDKEGVYGCDLHNELFNSSEEYIYYADAEKDLEEVGSWTCIDKVISYHNDNYGEFKPNSIDPCYFANMMVYIIGEGLLQNSDHLIDECWNREMTEEDLAIIEDELQSYLDGLECDLTEIAFE